MNRNRQTQQSRLQLEKAAREQTGAATRPISLQDALRVSLLNGKRTHRVSVVVHMDDGQSEANARRRVHAWLETFGHTSVSHGFEFLETESST